MNKNSIRLLSDLYVDVLKNRRQVESTRMGDLYVINCFTSFLHYSLYLEHGSVEKDTGGLYNPVKERAKCIIK